MSLDNLGRFQINAKTFENKSIEEFVLQEHKGMPNGVASLDASAKIPNAQLSGAGTTIIEFPSLPDFPSVGSSGTIYVALDTNISYQWSGSTYAQVSSNTSGGDIVDPHNYYSVSENKILDPYDVVSVKVSGLILTLPSSPTNGDEISVIIENGIIDTQINPGGDTIDGVTSNYSLDASQTSVYLLYIDGWKTVDNTQVISIGKKGNYEYMDNTDYMPDNTTYNSIESTIYNKSALEESWELNGNDLARQVTIVQDENNFISTWVEKETAVDKIVTFSSNKVMPIITYRKNNKIAICELLGIDWKQYETFSDFISVASNLRAVTQDQSVLNLIRDSTSNWNDFILSDALPLVNTPTMTSSSGPSGVAMASSSYQDFYPWIAFDKNPSSFWTSNTDADEWVSYEFPSDVNLFLHTFTIRQRDNETAPKDIIVQRSTDGSTWVNHDILQLIGGPNYDTRTYQLVKANSAARYWRVMMLNNYGGANISVCEIDFHGWNII